MAGDEQHAVSTQQQRCGCVVKVKQIRQLLSSPLFCYTIPVLMYLREDTGRREGERGEEPPTKRGNGKWETKLQ